MTQRVITFHYTLTDTEGNKLDSSIGQDPLMYLEGSGQIIPGLEKELANLKPTDKKVIQVLAKDAYGLKEQKYILQVPREDLPKGDITIGDVFQAGEEGESFLFRVVEVTPSHATLDGNHPLAGMDLTFDVEMIEMRPATKEELDHGHAHGGDGHHHH